MSTPIVGNSTSTTLSPSLPAVKKERWYSFLFDAVAFFIQYLRSPTAVGTPFACSSFVAKEIIKYVPDACEHSEQGRHFLEIGPGTGAFTDHFISKMGPNDRLDLVEIEEAFSKMLTERYQHDPRVSVHHLSITDWKPAYQYDHIVTAVPLNALPTAALVKPILDSYKALAAPSGTLSAVEYVGTSTLKRFFIWNKEKQQEFDKVQELKTQFFAAYSNEQAVVFRNIPPARVFQCKMTS